MRQSSGDDPCGIACRPPGAGAGLRIADNEDLCACRRRRSSPGTHNSTDRVDKDCCDHRAGQKQPRMRSQEKRFSRLWLHGAVIGVSSLKHNIPKWIHNMWLAILWFDAPQQPSLPERACCCLDYRRGGWANDAATNNPAHPAQATYPNDNVSSTRGRTGNKAHPRLRESRPG